MIGLYIDLYFNILYSLGKHRWKNADNAIIEHLTYYIDLNEHLLAAK